MTDWEEAFEDSVATERMLMIELIDASRAMQGELGGPGLTEAEAAESFAQCYAKWHAAVRAVIALAEQRVTSQ
jgi:hypothetical protein